MKTYLDCFPCFVKQALNAGRMATDDEVVIKKLIDRVGEMMKDIPPGSTPPETGDRIYRLVREYTGNDDPFMHIKRQHIREALELYPYLEEKMAASHDRMLTAIRIAIAGNVMDLGVGRKFAIREDLDEILDQDFGIFDYDAFRQAHHEAEHILYLGDNAGESVFDRILIEALEKPLTYVVRDEAVINDVTMDDAIASGLDRAATLISNGSSAPGTILDSCSDGFLHQFNKATMIISKGQGNYEGLSGTAKPIFFLLKAKCRVIARDLGVQLNDIILKSALPQQA